MSSFFSKLFGAGAAKKPQGPFREDPVSYEGLSIIPAPEKTGDGQWRLYGFIVKADDSGSMERFFVRADSYPSREMAVDFSLAKGKQIIDEQGKLLFADGEPTGRA
jgi:hypothetical protein